MSTAETPAGGRYGPSHAEGGKKAAHGVPSSTITKIAKRCLEANAWGHARYVYLTDLEYQCSYQGTVHLVAYAEPADALPKHYHHVKTVMERSSLTWWYEELLESALKREWPRAAARGLVRPAGQDQGETADGAVARAAVHGGGVSCSG